MGRAREPEGDRPSELEQLGDELARLGEELGCRDISVTLGPDSGDLPVLEVLNRRLVGVGKPAGAVLRVWRQAGAFWWADGQEALGTEDEIRRAADRIAAALGFSRQALHLPAPHPEPGST